MLSTLLTLLAAVTARDALITRLGPVKGDVGVSRDGRTFRKFLGVPYAKPPTGRRRFQDPVPVKPWFLTKDCRKVKPPCIQSNGNGTIGVEDCLYLNIFTPIVKPEERFPVMVYIHGGFGHGSGFGASSGDYLIDEEIVLIDVQYRLGVLGFPTVETFPANLGLKDQAMALTWVRENVDSFGGDVDNVTVFGGGSATHLHMLFSQGLKGVISHGGAFDRFRFIRSNGKGVPGCNPDPKLTKCLQKMTPGQVQSSGLSFGPSIETDTPGAFIKSDPLELKPTTPWIIGVSRSSYLQEVMAKVDFGDVALARMRARLGDLTSYSSSADFQLYALGDALVKHAGAKYLYMYDGSIDPLVLGAVKDESDESTSRYFVRLWSNFAKYGEPDVNYRLWTEGSAGDYLKIGPFSRMEEDFNTDSIKFWSTVFPQSYPPK
ncbi:venom carboxylesterase-6-like [Cimex lectularius]|uniref:Carboxylesterase type B domain-containing protein n=1 Tax=Cimex lectularius TaxID=79782 RepID=A0A8I6SGE6_CIMLE|nr:venom carboxylesterase-6-like [Cimex lectularius]XP_024080839.1 venom carboxylesterase-6-like [Cimex lectularius]